MNTCVHTFPVCYTEIIAILHEECDKINNCVFPNKT